MASGGNPLLDPWKANAFDISYEKYFEARRATCRRRTSTRTCAPTSSPDARTYDFSQFITPDIVAAAADTTIGQFTAPYNGEGGRLQGLELTASLPLDMFWDAAEGFGFLASASFNDSNITIRRIRPASRSVGSQNINLPGLSDEVYNLTAYYARAGFEARVNQRWRSDYIGEISNFAAERTLRYVEGEDITDAQLSYAFGEESALKGAHPAPAGQQPHQLRLPHLRLHEGPSAREHRVGPHLPGGRQLQVLITTPRTDGSV